MPLLIAITWIEIWSLSVLIIFDITQWYKFYSFYKIAIEIEIEIDSSTTISITIKAFKTIIFTTNISFYYLNIGAARVALGADLPAVFSNSIAALMVRELLFFF